MVKRVKGARKARDDSETPSSADEETKVLTIFSDDDDDDAEANEDLSLKIIEKAKRRTAKQNGDVLDSVTMVTNLVNGSASELKKKEKKKKKRKNEDEVKKKERVKKKIDKKKNKEIKALNDSGEEIKREKKFSPEKVAETNTVEASDNAVLRRLLRGPRYFDPPDSSSWGNCYNCGEEGHAAVNCTAAKRKKPCFVCGDLEHNAKQCTKRQDCYICKKGGHRAKDCPEKSKGGTQNYKICLKCGDVGHEMFSCRNNYTTDDLKEIQCFVCRKFGHLCCVEYKGDGPRDVSCYKCGVLGHTGLACTGGGSRKGEISGGGSLISTCYRCGEEGHFARECMNSAKVVKRNRDWSTPKKIKFDDDTDYSNYKKKKTHEHKRGGWSSEEFHDSSSKRRGGWATEYPSSGGGGGGGGWRSPATPNNYYNTSTPRKYNDYATGHKGSPSKSYRNYNSHSNSGSYGSTNHYNQQHHRFSASRFANSNDSVRRNYDW